jgi:hypothetical protein
MRIATMATGGIGGFLAVKLANAGHSVASIARGSHLDAIRANGLRLDSASGSEIARPEIATDRPDEVGVVDAIILGVKGHALDDAIVARPPASTHYVRRSTQPDPLRPRPTTLTRSFGPSLSCSQRCPGSRRRGGVPLVMCAPLRILKPCSNGPCRKPRRLVVRWV